MKRDYIEGQSASVTMFVGTEIERTPAAGMRTLFVVGLQSIEEIEFAAKTNECQHIYFGANHSFPDKVITAESWRYWERMISYFLELERSPKYVCTLDVDVNCMPGLTETGLIEHRNFIPMISVKLPYLQQLGYNATIKIDDIGFAVTNPGVWCHSLHDLMDRSAFTDWSLYAQDKIIK